MPKPHSVLAVANEFIELDRSRQTFTQMHLQKLCYMSHGFCLALLDRPLTIEPIEAWFMGPVYPELYKAVSKYKDNVITDYIYKNNWAAMPHIRGDIVRDGINKEEKSVIKRVFDDYGGFEAYQLSAITHESGSPWKRLYRDGVKHIVIPDRDIKDYFVGLVRQYQH